MKKVKLLKMVLENFRGRNLELNFNHSSVVYGDNGTGKTTVSDAHHWLWTGKDSTGSAKFQPKPLDSEFNVIHNKDVSVKEFLEVDGETIELERVWTEDWTKSRGDKQELRGHNTEFVINGVPDKQNQEFEQYVKENIFDGDFEILMILTNPYFFNELHWSKMREYLLKLEDISDTTVIEQNDYSIEKELKKHGAEFKTILESDLKGINKKLKSIPDRIDELNNTKKEVPEKAKSYYENQIELLDNLISKKESQKQTGEIDYDIVNDLKKKKSNIKTDMIKVRSKFQDDVESQKQVVNENITNLKDNINNLSSELKSVTDEREKLSRQKVEMNQEREDLVKEFNEIHNAKKNDLNTETVCPNCGHEIKDFELNGYDSFNQYKAQEKKRINNKGKELKDKLKKIETRLKEVDNSINPLEDNIKELQEELKAKKDWKAELKEKDFENTSDYSVFEKRLNEIDQDIEDEKNQAESGDTESIDAEIQELRDQRNEYREYWNIYKFNSDIDKKIKERTNDLKGLQKDAEKKEKMLNEAERFIQDRAFLLQKKVNDRFDIVDFKLFKEHIKGTIKEECICLVDGKPFLHDANTGNRINGGLDIINTFQKFYGLRFPAIVDNAESVTDLYNIDTQFIRLIKPEIDGENVEDKKEYYSKLKQRKFS